MRLALLVGSKFRVNIQTLKANSFKDQWEQLVYQQYHFHAQLEHTLMQIHQPVFYVREDVHCVTSMVSALLTVLIHVLTASQLHRDVSSALPVK